MSHVNNQIEVRIDGPHTTVRVNGTYWGYDPIDDHAWQVAELDLRKHSIDELIEIATLISGSDEAEILVAKMQDIYPDFPVTYYKS